jgi:hypothetical protein
MHAIDLQEMPGGTVLYLFVCARLRKPTVVVGKGPGLRDPLIRQVIDNNGSVEAVECALYEFLIPVDI